MTIDRQKLTVGQYLKIILFIIHILEAVEIVFIKKDIIIITNGRNGSVVLHNIIISTTNYSYIIDNLLESVKLDIIIILTFTK